MEKNTHLLNPFKISVENLNQILIQNRLFQLTIWYQGIRINGKIVKSWLQKDGADILALDQSPFLWELHQTICIRTEEDISLEDDLKVEIETEETGRLMIQNRSPLIDISKSSHVKKLTDLWKRNYSTDLIADAVDVCSRKQALQTGYAFQIDKSTDTISQWMDLESGKIFEWVIPLIKGLHPKTLSYRRHLSNQDPLQKTAFQNFLHICWEIEATPHVILPLSQTESFNLPDAIAEVIEAMPNKPWWNAQRIWEISCSGLTLQQSTERINKLREAAEIIKSKDPDATLILPGSDSRFSDGRQWNEKMLESCIEWIDQIGISSIFPGPKGWIENYANASYDHACGLPAEFDSLLKRISIQLESLDLHKKVRIAISPWSYFKQFASDQDAYHSNFTKQDAFYYQSVNNIIQKNGERLGVVESGFLFGPMGMIESNQGKYWKTVPYLLFSINCLHQNLILNIKTLPGKGIPAFHWSGIPGAAEAQSIPYLDTLFSRSENGKKMTLIILNRHPEKRALVRVNFMNFPDMRPIEAKVLHAKSKLSANTFENPEAVFCKEIPMRNYKPMDHVNLDIGPIGIAMMTLTSRA